MLRLAMILGPLGLALNLGSAAVGYAQESSATRPTPKDGAWMRVHEAYVRAGAKEPANLLFLGDSITQGWHGSGKEAWERYYVPRKVSNLGIGGDRTEHVLWRLDNGEIDVVRPRVVVLMIGTNNLGGNSPEEIASGVKAIVERLRSKLPESKILLLAVFPRGIGAGKEATEARVDPRIAAINAGISGLDDGKTIKYLDIGKVFLDDSGMIPRSIMPDFLHLSRKGYRLWADAMEPTLWEMMEGK